MFLNLCQVPTLTLEITLCGVRVEFTETIEKPDSTAYNPRSIGLPMQTNA
jgi:hypothetical protein